MPSHSLHELLAGRLCLVGIGNRMKGDDGAGPALIDGLLGCPGIDCVDAGVAPENHLEHIAGLAPDVILFIDAMDLGAKPGTWRIIDHLEEGVPGLSSHALPLSWAADYLRERLPARVLILGIQPETVQLGAPLSRAVHHTVDTLVAQIQRLLPPG